MTTIENIHMIIENKISISERIYDTIVFKANQDYTFQKNKTLLEKTKADLDFSIDEYLINAAYYLHSYASLLNEESFDYSKFLTIDNNSTIDKSAILELIHIFKSNEYSYRYSKTAGYTNKVQLKQVYDKFKTFVRKCGIIDRLDTFVSELVCFYKLYCEDSDSFMALVDRYNKIYLSLGKNQEIKYDTCDCGNKMIIQSNTSELLCIRCGYTCYLIGSVTEEAQLFAQEGNRVSHGSYDPVRHCKFWIERIQAKENTNIPQEQIDKIKRAIMKDYSDNIRNITVKQFRSYLKNTGLSKLNDHIPLIKKIITGYIPPQLTFREQQLLFIYFDKATRTYEKIKPSNKKNSLYYPFLIYKILDIIIDDTSKKNKLLDCIHLQSYETLIDNDKIWFEICKKNECFSYRATDRNG
jgi:hypothetical protein